MKKETIITTIMTIMVTSLIVSIVCGLYYVPKLKSEYLRGLKKGHDTHLIDSVTYGDIFYDTTLIIHYSDDTIRIEKQ